MGGCASKPKDLDIRPESVPTEAPVVADPPKAEGETIVAQENVVAETVKNEEPLVDLSEPKDEGVEKATTESTSPDVEVVADLVVPAIVPTKETVEATEDETKKEVEDVKETTNVEVTPEVEVEKKDTPAPTSEDKSDAPLVNV